MDDELVTLPEAVVKVAADAGHLERRQDLVTGLITACAAHSKLDQVFHPVDENGGMAWKLETHLHWKGLIHEVTMQTLTAAGTTFEEAMDRVRRERDQ